jgi:hypothetical protein
MKKFAFAIACTFVFTPALAAEKAVAKKEPIKMTSSEMEKVVAGASTVYRNNGWGYYGYDGGADWKGSVAYYNDINYKPGNTNGF